MKLLKGLLTCILFWIVFAVVGNILIEDFDFKSYSLMSVLSFIYGVIWGSSEENPNEPN